MRLKTIGKRGAGLLLSALLALSLCLPVSAAGGAGYTDLRGHWAESQLQWAVEQGYLTGTSATTLSPNKTLTRGMAAVILYRYAGSPTAGENSQFSDVPAGAYYAKAVAWVDQAGLMSGRGNGRFAPQANMTREEFLTVLYRLRVQAYGVPEQVGEQLGHAGRLWRPGYRQCLRQGEPGLGGGRPVPGLQRHGQFPPSQRCCDPCGGRDPA